MRNQSLSNAKWFYVKKRKIGKEYLYSTKNQLSENEMWGVADDLNDTCHTCTKDSWIRTLIKQLLTKYQLFTKLPQISLIHKTFISKQITDW